MYESMQNFMNLTGRDELYGIYDVESFEYISVT